MPAPPLPPCDRLPATFPRPMATFDVAPLVEPPPAPSEETSDNGIRLVAKLAVKRTGLPLDRFSRLVSPSEAATLLSPPVTPAVAVDNVEGKAELDWCSPCPRRMPLLF